MMALDMYVWKYEMIAVSKVEGRRRDDGSIRVGDNSQHADQAEFLWNAVVSAPRQIALSLLDLFLKPFQTTSKTPPWPFADGLSLSFAYSLLSFYLLHFHHGGRCAGT